MAESREIHPQPHYVDKKRIAICGGTLGRENRYYARGQVVDVGITDPMRAEDMWDFVTGLFTGQEKDITPFLDFSLAPVRKPILKVEIIDSKGKVVVASGEVRGDEDGFFSHEFTEKLKPGKYHYQVLITGLDSYRQYTKDIAYLNQHGPSELGKASLIGKGRLRILPESYTGITTTSDIDQTYLATDIHSNKGKFSTVFETPDQKQPLPGMPLLYRKLRDNSDDTPLCFISASPHFFRRTLFATIKGHGITIESLHLKYLEGTIKGMFDKFFDTMLHPTKLLSGGLTSTFDRIRKFAGSSIQSLFDQMSYKLTILLKDRLYLPTGAREILMGDNTESDFMIFLLYQLILTGEIADQELEDYLYKLDFLGRDAITRDSAKEIRSLAEECIRIHGKTNSVELVLINRTEHGPDRSGMWAAVEKALPPSVDLKTMEHIHPFYCTEGALGFACVLASKGYLDSSSVFEIAGDLVGKILNGKFMDDKELLKLAETLEVPDFAKSQKESLNQVLEQALRSA